MLVELLPERLVALDQFLVPLDAELLQLLGVLVLIQHVEELDTGSSHVGVDLEQVIRQWAELPYLGETTGVDRLELCATTVTALTVHGALDPQVRQVHRNLHRFQVTHP